MDDTEAKTSEKHLNYNSVAALVFVALSIALWVLIPDHVDKPLIRVVGDVSLPAELFPQVIAVGIFVLGIWFFWKSRSLHQRNELRDLDREAITNVAVTAACMAGYVWLMVNIGFVMGSMIMIFVVSTYFGNRNYWAGALVSIIVPFALFMLFTKVLVTSLPPFPIDEAVPSNWAIYEPLKWLSNKSVF